TTLLAFALACTIQVQGEIIFDSFAPGNSFATNHPDPVGAGFRLAVPFTSANAVLLDSLTVAMSHVAENNAVRLTVRPDAGGVPGETVLDTMEAGGFPTIDRCVINRSCSLDAAGPGTVQTATSTLHPL